MFSSCNGVNGCWWMFYLHIIHTGSTSSPKKTIARRIRWRCPLVSLPHRSISRPLVCKFQALGNALLFQGVFGKQTVGPRWRDVTFSSSHGFLLDNDVTIWYNMDSCISTDLSVFTSSGSMADWTKIAELPKGQRQRRDHSFPKMMPREAWLSNVAVAHWIWNKRKTYFFGCSWG